MKFKKIHENYNVSDLDRSIKFYNEALDLHEVRRTTTDDFIIVVFMNHLKFHNSSPFVHSVFLMRDLYCGYSVMNRLITLASFQ